MSAGQVKFLEISEKIAFDTEHRQKINHNISKYNSAVATGKLQYSNLELARTRAAVIKSKVIDKLDNYLIEFESNFIKRGGKVIWAQDADEAIAEILKILTKAGVKTVVKSKSMATEEIHLNEALAKNKIDSIETDLGEYIQQLAGEPPYHIVTPAMHKSKEDIAKLLHSKIGTPENANPNELTLKVREILREKFVKADAGITGANFLIADTGAVALTENEGNSYLSVAFPKIHISIAGIEKIIPSITDLDLFFPLLSTFATGQNLSVYNNILTGPKQAGEIDGPEEMYVILLDNGRSNILNEPEQRRALNCIKCGACLNVCPVYKNVGGHAYDSTYPGPIGSILTPYFKDKEEYKHLSYASTICGACTNVCPVNIDLHKLLLYNRRDTVANNLTSKKENWTMYFWKNAMLKRAKMEKGGATVKNFMLKQFFKKSWGDRRELPVIAQKSFNQLWKERKGLK